MISQHRSKTTDIRIRKNDSRKLPLTPRFFSSVKKKQKCTNRKLIQEYKKHTGFMPWATVTQSIANIAFYNHFKLIFTESMAETCAMLREMAKHIKNFKEPQTHDISIDALQDAADRRKPQNKNGQMINLFLCFHGMTPSKAVKLAEDVGHVKNLKYGIEGIISNKNYLTNAMKKQLILFFKPY
jgi:ERCC4-type nuclease